MFGNGGNPFGVLSVEEPSSIAGPSAQVVEGEELDVDWLRLVKPNHDVNVRVSDGVELQDLPDECNLLAVSNLYGLLLVGGNNDVRIHRLADVQAALDGATKDATPASSPVQVIPLSARPIWIRLAMNEGRLVIATANGTGVHAFKLQDVLSGNTTPYHSFTSNIPSHLLDLLPNPAPTSSDQLARYVALIASEGLVIADLEEGKLSAPLAGPFTCASWSAKGKQIAVGTPSGKLVQYTPEGVAKAEVPPPPELESYHPVSVQWLENDLFHVSYALDGAGPDEPLEVYIIHRQKTSFTYTKFYDPLNSMGYAGRSSAYRQFAALKQWGEKTKHLAFVVSGIASEIGVMHGQAAAEKEPPIWEVLMLDETARGGLPAAQSGVRDDASALGLAVDLTGRQPIKQGIVGGIEQPDIPPPPRLLVYSQEGAVISFNILYAEAGPYPGMTQPQAISASSAVTQATPANVPMDMGTRAKTPSESTLPVPATPAPAAFGSSAFGSAAFGQSTSAKPATAFGSSAFGQGSSSAFSTPSKPAAFGSSSFGQSSTPQSTPGASTSAFGSSTTPGAFGSTSGASGFGQSAFGKTAPSGFGQSAFGQTSKPAAFGSSAFGTPSAPSTQPPSSSTPPTSTSAFGSASNSGTAFGQSAFGKPSTPAAPTAFGQSSFGQSAKPAASASAFGAPAFGQLSKPSPSAPSAFGSSSSPSAFGSPTASTNTNLGFGAFGGGKSSTTSGFGFGSSAFGQTAKSDEKKENGTGSSSPFGSGGSAFGSSSAFGQSSFGQSAFGQKPAGSPSTEPAKPAFTGFGPQSTASKPAFTGFGPPKSVSPAPVPAPSTSEKKDQDDFGLGGIASALETSKPAGVPGLEESPPGSPVLGSTNPSGIEDDSPPASPLPSFAAPIPKTTAPTTTSSTSSFIKPATAFGDAPTFGNFGSASTSKPSTPAFGSGSKPAAFATPPSSSTSTTPAAPSVFGSPAFGQSSAIGRPAFGSSSFGKPSTPTTGSPSAFGSKPIGNITGGFGAFGAKSEGEKKPTGFGGFASAGTSIFGSGPDTAEKTKGNNEEKEKPKSPISVFGSATASTSSAFGHAFPPTAFGAKPSSPSSANDTAQPDDKDAKSTAPSSPDEEVKGFDVPPSPSPATEDKAGQSTTPTATPVKDAKQPSTSSIATPSVAKEVSTTTPPAATSKSETPTEPTSPLSQLAQLATASPDALTDTAAEIPATTGPKTEEPSQDVVKEDPAATADGPADAGREVERSDDEYDEGETFDDEGETYDEEQEDEDEEDYEENYEDEDDYEEDEEEYEDEGEEERVVKPRSRRSSSVPPDMSPILEQASAEEESGSEEAGGEEETAEETVIADGNGSAATETAAKEASPEASASKTSMKSPPAWFTLPPKTTSIEPGPISPTPSSTTSPETSSLFSRLGPPPLAAPQPVQAQASPSAPDQGLGALKPPVFSSKHAARTPSPLAAQPPENAESTTPESSPAKDGKSSGLGLFGAKPNAAAPAFTGFGSSGAKVTDALKPVTAATTASPSFFAPKPADIDKKPAAVPAASPSFFSSKPAEDSQTTPTPPAALSGFGLFGNQTTATPPALTSPAATAPPSFFGAKPADPAKASAPSFGSFGAKPADSGLTQGPPSLFASAAAKTVPQSNDVKPSFGLGLGRPGQPSPSIAAQTPPATESKTSPSFFAGLNGNTTSKIATPVLAKTEPETTTAPVSFTVPKRPTVPLPPSRPEGSTKSMGALIERMITDLQNDIQYVNATLKTNAAHHKGFTVPNMPKITSDNLTKHDVIPFSSISDLTTIVEQLSEELSHLRTRDNGSEVKFAELQSRMVKTDMKIGQADKFLKARQDPSFAKVLQIRDLSPQQAASQVKLRKVVQVIEARLEELDASVSGLKKRVDRREQGKGATAQPALERVQRSVRNIDAAIRDRHQTIDDLTRRISGIRLASPSRNGSPARTPAKQISTSNLNGSLRTISFEPPQEVLDEVQRTLSAGSRMKRFEGIKVAKLTKPSAPKKDTALARSAASNGPVFIDALPLPGYVPPPTPSSTTIKTEPQARTPPSPALRASSIPTPTATSAPPSSGAFGGIKFSLDPGDISALASSRQTNRAGTSHRSHTPAPKFVPTVASASPESAGSAGTGAGMFSFAPPKEGEKSAAVTPTQPSPGFFSFSGFGKK